MYICTINFRTATTKQIKSAYKKLAAKWHPDKYKGDEKTLAEKKFIDIAAAKEVLTDKGKNRANLFLWVPGLVKGVPRSRSTFTARKRKKCARLGVYWRNLGLPSSFCGLKMNFYCLIIHYYLCILSLASLLHRWKLACKCLIFEDLNLNKNYNSNEITQLILS